jgi:hypothetical protein
MKTCGKCGKEGHNARTCKGSGAAKATAKASPAPSRATVKESLIARQKQLRHELAVLDRVLADLNTIGVS